MKVDEKVRLLVQELPCYGRLDFAIDLPWVGGFVIMKVGAKARQLVQEPPCYFSLCHTYSLGEWGL